MEAIVHAHTNSIFFDTCKVTLDIIFELKKCVESNEHTLNHNIFPSKFYRNWLIIYLDTVRKTWCSRRNGENQCFPAVT